MLWCAAWLAWRHHRMAWRGSNGTLQALAVSNHEAARFEEPRGSCRWLPMAERVELELLCLPGDRVAAALHLRVAGTPVRSFASPLHGHQQLSSRSLDASAAHLAAAAIADEALKAAPELTAEGCAAAAAAAPAQVGQQADLSSRPAGQSQAAPGHAGPAALAAAAHAELSDTAAGPVPGSTAELEAAAAVGAAPTSGTSSSSSSPAPGQQQEEEQEQQPAAAAAAPSALVEHALANAPDGAAGAAGGGGSGSAASLDAVMGMLRQLLASSSAAQQQAPAPPEQVRGALCWAAGCM